MGLASEIPQIICDEFDIETRKCKSEVVEFLLLQGADFREGIYGQSYLHWAAENGHLSVVEYLFNQKADINSKNNAGKTPMTLASEINIYDSEDDKKRKSNVVEFLKRKGGQ